MWYISAVVGLGLAYLVAMAAAVAFEVDRGRRTGERGRDAQPSVDEFLRGA